MGACAPAPQSKGRNDVEADPENSRRLPPQAQDPSSLAKPALRRQTPEVGAECPNGARSDLCGGMPAMAFPTAMMPRRRSRRSADLMGGSWWMLPTNYLPSPPQLSDLPRFLLLSPQAVTQPNRQRTAFQTDPPSLRRLASQRGGDRLRRRSALALPERATALVNDANRGLILRYVQSNILFHGCPPWGSSILPIR